MPARLVTIPFSHYCEKARWALDRAQVPYLEQGYPPGFSGGAARRAGGGRSVPVLVPEAGSPVPDSTDILRWCDAHGTAPSPLFPPGDADAVALEERFDLSLGPAARRVAYAPLLDDPGIGRRLLDAGDRWPRRLPAVVGRGLAGLIRRGLKIDAAGVARSTVKLEEDFAEVARRLADGRRYLTGAAFTAADLTFAALAAPVIWPDAYARFVGPLAATPPAMQALVAAWRATTAGAFALRVYAEQR